MRVKPCGPVHGPCAEATCPSVEGRLAERKTPPVGASTEARKRTWPRDASPGTHVRGSVDPCAGLQGLRGRAWGARGGGGLGRWTREGPAAVDSWSVTEPKCAF